MSKQLILIIAYYGSLGNPEVSWSKVTILCCTQEDTTYTPHVLHGNSTPLKKNNVPF